MDDGRTLPLRVAPGDGEHWTRGCSLAAGTPQGLPLLRLTARWALAIGLRIWRNTR